MKRGDTITATCKTCPATITYILHGRRMLYCPACRKANINLQSKRHYATNAHRHRLADGEMTAQHIDGLGSVVCMTQAEASARLAVWESMDAKIKTGKFSLIRPLTQQRVQQIERMALAKLRRALAPIYKQMMEERQIYVPRGRAACQNSPARDIIPNVYTKGHLKLK